MKRLFFLLLILSFFEISFSQETFGDNKKSSSYAFGVRIVSADSGVGRFYAIYSPDGKTMEQIISLSRKDFVSITLGLQNSEYNINNLNYFAKSGAIDSVKLMSRVIDIIGQVPDDKEYYEYQKRVRYNNAITRIANSFVGDLWKLRYAEYPYGGSLDSLGWTNNSKNTYMPRDEQMEILKEYGIEKINDYIWGDNLFRLFKDMKNPDWRKAYSEAGAEE